MMIVSHALLGGVIGILSMFIAPSELTVAIIAGGIGGLIPDLDMLLDHRRTLHFPFTSTVLLLPAFIAFVLVPMSITTVLFFGLAGMAFHAYTDILGEGRVMRHWVHIDHRAVYDHVTDRWVYPRRVIKTGQGTDLFVTAFSGSLLVRVVDSPLSYVVVVLVVVAFVFTITLRPAARIVSDDYVSIEAFIKAKLRSLFEYLKSVIRQSVQ